MGFRPRDLCSAAFENDVRRLRLLATSEGVPGGYENEEPTEEEEQAVEADDEMKRLQELFVSQQHEDEVEEDEADLFTEEEEAQTELVQSYRALIHQKLRLRAIATKLNTPGLLHAGGTTPATTRSYGVLFQAREDAAVTSSGSAHLSVNWKPSKRSPFTATPLHWAVLGRAHDAIHYLVLNGADVQRSVGQPPDNLHGPTSPTPSPAVFPPGLTAEAMSRDNASHDTLKVLLEAIQKRAEASRAHEQKKLKIESELEQIKARREKRRLELDQRRTAAEEAEEVEENEDNEDNDDYDDE